MRESVFEVTCLCGRVLQSASAAVNCGACGRTGEIVWNAPYLVIAAESARACTAGVAR